MRGVLLFLLSLVSTVSFGKGKSAVFKGDFHPFAVAEGADKKISGKLLVKMGASSTDFTLYVKGLNQKEMYVSHVHALPCSVDSAGGHYKFDTSVSTAVEENEIWFSIPPFQKSIKVKKKVNKVLRSDAKSVVVHRMKGEAMLKVACADMELSSR